MKAKIEWLWIIKITVITFVISFLFTLASETIIPKVNIIVSIILILIFILIGVIFDMVGVAATASDVKSFHSMSARKIKEARVAIDLINNSEKVSSFCNDVLGDICGIISGSGGAALSLMIYKTYDLDPLLITLTITAIIAALTVCGKAICKTFAVNQSEKIVLITAKVVSFLNIKI